MKILFVCGGTGGHINPAIAVAKEIRKRNPDAEILFIGTSGRMEEDIVPAAGFRLETVEMNGLSRKKTFKAFIENIKTIILTLKASKKAGRIIKEFAPDVAVGFGGYVTEPVIRAASKLKVPTCIHEQNAFPGVANKALAKIVDKVMLTSPEAEKYMKCKNSAVVTGLPVRKEIVSADRQEARKQLGIGDDEILVLSMGGSLGANVINNSVLEMLTDLHMMQGVRFIHATGRYGKWLPDKLRENGVPFGPGTNIDIREYISDMEVCMPACDIVISRAGASSVSEISALGKPSIIIPSPNVAENHQFHNAMTLAQNGGAVLIEEKDIVPGTLTNAVKDLIENPDRLREISEKASENTKTDALDSICKVITSLVKS